ncbi:hypothetical protein J6590_097775 [Homalodisca vitripennis]|nr:hypothetical protein J6590_097775 [Homalodisca vitripennis]
MRHSSTQCLGRSGTPVKKHKSTFIDETLPSTQCLGRSGTPVKKIAASSRSPRSSMRHSPPLSVSGGPGPRSKRYCTCKVRV